MARPKAAIKTLPRALSLMHERLDEWRRGNAPRVTHRHLRELPSSVNGLSFTEEMALQLVHL